MMDGYARPPKTFALKAGPVTVPLVMGSTVGRLLTHPLMSDQEIINWSTKVLPIKRLRSTYKDGP